MFKFAGEREQSDFSAASAVSLHFVGWKPVGIEEFRVKLGEIQ
jgi:hypothetical protein